MSLSNTAVPKYYAEFRDAVVRGEIPICRHIAQQMERIDKKIANPDYYYDDKAIDGWIDFCESELTQTDGTPLSVLPSFKLWAEDLLAWYYFVDKSVYNPETHCYEVKRVKKRLTKKQYLIIARGAAKSMYDEFHQAYQLVVNPKTTHQITTAPTMRQSEEVMSAFRTAITRANGDLFKFLTQGSIQNTTGSRANRQKLVPTKLGIQNFISNSLLEVRPMSVDKLQGLRPFVSTVDEWLSGDIKEDVIGAIEQGASKMDDYIIIATSSEGTVRNGPGDDIKLELESILKGDFIADQVSIWWYMLDDISEVNQPEMWVKANPNLGLTISYEAYQQDVERATNNPAARNDILAKRFGIPMEGYTYFFTYEETIPHKVRNFWSMPCAMGCDLSMGDDFCAFTFLFPTSRGEFGVKARSYVSETTMAKLPTSKRIKYESFIEEGSLIVMPGTVLDMMEVYDNLDQHIIDCQYDVRTIGYDPYNAKDFVDRWIAEHGQYGVERVIQGARTESVPLGELKHLASERLLLFDELIMQFTMGNCITLEDTNGNRKLLKQRYDQKIDNVSALMDAWVAFKLHRDDCFD